MTDRPYRGSIDYERLAEYFRVLSTANRLQLLHKLQLPLTIAEIELPPSRRDRTRQSDRPLSRQAVENHLRQLEEIGLVRARAARREGLESTEYVVNPSRLFVVTDELRRLGLIRPPSAAVKDWSRATGAGATAEAGASRTAPAIPDAPALVLVSGPMEGTAFPLAGKGPWIVGRSAAVAVPIPHDPFVSIENTEVRVERERWTARDIPASRNGTTVNWRLLEEREEVALRPGDTLGVGRSLLVFRP